MSPDGHLRGGQLGDLSTLSGTVYPGMMGVADKSDSPVLPGETPHDIGKEQHVLPLFGFYRIGVGEGTAVCNVAIAKERR